MSNNIVNGENVGISNQHQFDDDTNIVKTVYKNTITNYGSMFYGSESIIEMNLTNFKTSKVTEMGSTSVNL